MGPEFKYRKYILQYRCMFCNKNLKMNKLEMASSLTNFSIIDQFFHLFEIF